METLLFARDHDGKLSLLEMGDPDANDAFKKIVNAGRENSDHAEIALVEVNLYDARKRESFIKPLTDDQRKAVAAHDEKAGKAQLLEEARTIQRNNTAAETAVRDAKARIQPLTAEHKAVLEEAASVVAQNDEATKKARAEKESAKQDLDKLTADELRDLAKKEGITVGAAKTKDQLIGIIVNARKRKASEPPSTTKSPKTDNTKKV